MFIQNKRSGESPIPECFLRVHTPGIICVHLNKASIRDPMSGSLVGESVGAVSGWAGALEGPSAASGFLEASTSTFAYPLSKIGSSIWDKGYSEVGGPL